MKRIKKLAALMMAAIMALAMSITAFAADEKPATVTHTYEIYQIFTGDYADGVLSNVKWGVNGTGKVDEKVDTTVLEELEAIKDATSDTDKLKVITKYANLKSIPVETGTKTIYEGLTSGYYLVKDKDGSLTNSTDEAYTLYVVQVVDNKLEFTPKADVPSTDKKIVEGKDKVTTNEASIGDEVNYEITGTMPSNIADYKTYYYMFTDTLSKGLTYKENSIKVTVNGEDVTKYFYKGVGAYNETTGTTIEVGILDIKALSLLTDPAVGEITKDTKVVLTYTATLNENAVIAGDGNPNDVKLSYSNDPNNSGNGSTTPPENPNEPKPTHPTGETPEIEVVTYTTELTILKTDEDNKFLPGVEFTLTGNGVNIVLVTEETFTEAADGEYWKLKDGTYTTTAPTVADDETDNTADYDSVDKKYTKTVSVVAKGKGETKTDVVGTVMEDGTVTFTGLGAGEYTITETKTLPGYNTIDPITFTLTFNAETKTFVSDNENVTVGEDNMLDTSIVNQKGSLLPSTGGIGTTIFYIVGAVLVIGAGIILVTKKRMSNEV
ncbi:trypsin-resistant surface T6 protein [Lachnospiraceae bacterium]|nr:trypsin-resistant surface T6 protein [Lachnospiraceae bacterium]